jgi:putative ABC transport system permease protein
VNWIALLESTRVGLNELRANPLRTMLATTGVTIGVAALVAAFAISDGVAVWSRALILRESSVQNVTITWRAADTINGRVITFRRGPEFTHRDAAAARAEVPGVAGQMVTISGMSRVVHRDRSAPTLLTLSSADLAEFSTLPLAAGRFYTDAEVARGARVIVLGEALARELGAPRDPLWLIGRTVRVASVRLEVIGIVAPVSHGSNRDFAAFAPLKGSLSTFGVAGVASSSKLHLKARSIEAVDTLHAAVVDWLNERYGRAASSLQVSVANEQLANTRKAMLLTKLLLGMLVALILGVGGIGIMNVLLAAVAERTREIGIRLAVGARARDIQAQFLVESMIVTGAGAIAGIAIGLVLAFAGTAVFRHFLGSDIHPVMSVGTALLAVSSSAAVGLLFGTYPARRAASLTPMEAIARE